MKKYSSSSVIKILTLMVFIIAVVLLIALLRNNSSGKISSGRIKTINTQPSLINPNNSSDGSNNKNPTSLNQEKSSTNSQPTTSYSLTAPYGSFVSNHKPGQNGSNLTELSQCITTPGATCYIRFTRNGVELSLPQHTVNPDGSTFWEWNINTNGLASGQWTITAVASLHGQTKTTTDQLTLEVL